MTSGKIVTVRGPIEPAVLGATLTHEHLFIDLRVPYYQTPTTDMARKFAHSEITISNLAEVRYRPFSHWANLKIDDLDVVLDEVAEFARVGGRSIVDVSPPSMGRDVVKLRRVAERTGVNVICGSGYYTERSYTNGLGPMEPAEVADELCRELLEGVGDTGVRPGVIGEIGTSCPPSKGERIVLNGSALAHRTTGAPISVHLSSGGDCASQVLDTLEADGTDLTKVALGHMDAKHPLDVKGHATLAARGAYVEYDMFGWPDFSEEGVFLPAAGDLERLDAVRALWNAGVGDRLLLSHDVCTKMQQRAYGGVGFAHLNRFIVPMFRRMGLSDEQIDTMIRVNPARWLTWRTPTA
jgi:phosphotriesterase-related protein